MRASAGPEKDGQDPICQEAIEAKDDIGFTFDRVFDTSTRQDEIFDWGVKGIVEGTRQERYWKS